MQGDRTDNEDIELVTRCLEGDVSAQERLIAKYAGLCYSVARKILPQNRSSHVDDAVQEAFCAVFSKLNQWRGEHLPAWIGTIASRRAIELRRSLERRSSEKTGTTLELSSNDAKEHENYVAMFREVLEIADRRLTERQRAILAGLLEGRSRLEIAASLVVSERTVYGELAEIRRHLKRILETFADGD